MVALLREKRTNAAEVMKVGRRTSFTWVMQLYLHSSMQSDVSSG